MGYISFHFGLRQNHPKQSNTKRYVYWPFKLTDAPMISAMGIEGRVTSRYVTRSFLAITFD